MTAPDIEAVCAIEERSFSTPWSPASFRALIDRPGWSLLVVDDTAGEIIAYAAYWWLDDEAELASIAVRPESRGQGYGSALLDHVLQAAARRGVRHIFLELRPSNVTAGRLYARFGFEQVGTRPDYYDSPAEDALVLAKVLSTGSSGA